MNSPKPWPEIVAGPRPEIACSYLAHAGVSADIIAAWPGHADASFTMRTYVHARPEGLAAARDAARQEDQQGVNVQLVCNRGP